MQQIPTFASVLLPAQNLGNHYVNGQTGQDIPTSSSSAQSPWKTIGYAMLRIPVPLNARLAGQTSTFQWWASLPGVNPLGIATSDGLRVTLGH